MIKSCERTAGALPGVEEIRSLAGGLCPVDWARSVTEAAREDLCGRGTMCRDGITQLWRIVDDISRGKGRSGDLDLLEDLCGVIETAGDCELSVRCAQLVRASVECHGEVWNAHITRKKCDALACRGCYTVHVDAAKCTGCGACAPVCPEGCIAGGEGLIHVVDSESCTRCGACFAACPAEAVIKAGAVKPRCPEEPVPVGSFGGGGAVRRRRRGRGE